MFPSIRVLIVDDHAVVRAGLRMLLESGPGMSVVGEAGNRTEALAAAREQPDVVLLDLDLGGDSALDFLPELLATAPRARVLVLTGVRDPELHRRAVRLGAMGLVFKEQAAETLFKAIEKVHAGEIWLGHAMTASLLGEMARAREVQLPNPAVAKIAALTGREREIIALLGEGLKNKQIAGRLFISEVTVRHHLTEIFARLGVAGRLDLLVYAYRHGLTRPPR